ncbi:MAG: ubiquinone/menaquinone biosynthesis methyltransferase [Planctomycetes bacterium]|nr:ubiquinone/menaquinone biosynthesis methyltransferase [Planctomycetota bacterium]
MTTVPEPSSQPVGWDRDTLRDPHGQADKAARVESMFDAIAPTYERVNTIASLGRDAHWRRRAVAAAQVRPADVVLDIACGTGDMIRTFAAASPSPALLVGVDFAANMLVQGRYADLATPLSLVRADALRLPLRDESVDVISCTFGVRNFAELAVGLREMCRVLRPGGRVVILEFALPDNRVLRWFYRLYCERIMPLLARLISGERVGAYRYLPQSVATFDSGAALAGRLTAAGFANATTHSLNLGGVVLCRAGKPPQKPA